MEPREVIERVHALAGPILLGEGFELVDVEFRREARGWVLRLYADKEGGITLDDCVRISQEVGRTLDVGDFIGTPYTLEVSSPGLTRSLKGEKDFQKYRGRLVKMTTSQAIENRRHLRGRLGEVVENQVRIEVDGKVFSVPLGWIARASLEIEF